MKVAVVCAMNMNRSMAGHKILMENGFDVYSYGTSPKIMLPGPSPVYPNVYDFGISYSQIYEELIIKDPELYSRNRVLGMLDRNLRIKEKPEYFFANKIDFDIIITCVRKSFDLINEYCMSNKVANKKIHLVNFDIVDTTIEAEIAAENIKSFVTDIFEGSINDYSQGFKKALSNIYSSTSKSLCFSIIEPNH